MMTVVSRRAFLSAVALGLSGLALAGCAESREGAAATTEGSEPVNEPSTVSESPADPPAPTESSTSRVLVACFSATGNTRAVAQAAARHLDADFVELEAVEPYTPEDLEYHDRATRATTEQNDDSSRPALASIPDFSPYEVVLLGHPIWWGRAPRLICTLLESADFSGTAIAEFCTSGSSGIEAAADELQSLAPDITWLEPQRFAAGASDGEVTEWIDSLGIR